MDERPKKLNVGCGDDILEGWDNCDSYPSNASVIKADLLTLRGVRSNYYKRVRLHMVLEHVHVDLVSTALHQVSRVLDIAGQIEITVPDLDYFFDLYTSRAKNKLSSTAGMMAFKEVCYQLLDPELDENLTTHQCFFNWDFLRLSLLQEGFSDIKRVAGQDGTLNVIAYKLEKISTFRAE